MRKSLILAAAFMSAMGIMAVGAGASAPNVKTNFNNTDTQPVKKKKIIVDKKAEKKKLEAEKRKPRRGYDANNRGCQGFFECMFGKPRNSYRVASRSDQVGDYETRSTVSWSDGKYKPGTIIIRTPERALYYVLPGGKALRYKVGVGKEGMQWSGNSRIVMKKEWPDWRPPKTMIAREAAKGHYIPEFMEGGPGNPLGARAMYIGGTLFRIHGTNNAASIGGAVSSGCIRMMNSDVVDLYERVDVGSRVYVYQ
jgi:lipoprotein-anchoring transpeptidase ErfK/SrfK